ncbi:C40 family peptidase [Micromonospora sp. DT31]|uniref:C40 family peptidase n=1 Tax=Micromonospora sp. DT31 TaxID=3393434 RepID=UPI003CF511D5
MTTRLRRLGSLVLTLATTLGLIAVSPTAAQAELLHKSIKLTVGCPGAWADLQINWRSTQEANVYWELKDTLDDGKTPGMTLRAENPTGGENYLFDGLGWLRATGGRGTVVKGAAWEFNPDSIGLINSLQFVVANGLGGEERACTEVKHVYNYGKNAYRIATSMIGTPYVLGGDSSGGLDCSGLVQWAFNHVDNFPGLSSNDTAEEMYEWARARADGNGSTPWGRLDAMKVGPADLEVGDLIFYDLPDMPRSIDHVGFYAGGDQVLDALPGRGVTKHTDGLASYRVGQFRIQGVS